MYLRKQTVDQKIYSQNYLLVKLFKLGQEKDFDQNILEFFGGYIHTNYVWGFNNSTVSNHSDSAEHVRCFFHETLLKRLQLNITYFTSITKLRCHPSRTYAKFSEKLTSFPLMRTRQNFNFSENFAYMLNERSFNCQCNQYCLEGGEEDEMFSHEFEHSKLHEVKT